MFLRKVKELIGSKKLIRAGDSVLVAVSGGADSVALIYALYELRGEWEFRMAAAHLNHGLRGASAKEDERHVTDLCRNLGLECSVGTVDTASSARRSGLSIEEAARELRYEFLRKAAAEGGHGRIALGHTMDDQAETVLMRTVRGAGIGGLSAMRPISENLFIRPLITTRRSEILEFLASEGIAYREDPSNLDTAFLRNRVRHELLQILKRDYNPRVVEALCSQASILAGVEDYLRLTACEAYEKCTRRETQENIELELSTFLSYHSCVQGYILREAFRRLCGSLRNLDFCHVESLLALASSGRSGDCIDVPSGIRANLDGKTLLIGLRTADAFREATPHFSVALEPGSTIRIPEISLSFESRLFRRRQPPDDFNKREPTRAFFDFEELEPPFTLRNLSPGDRISPFGMKGSKKVQDLLVDMKVPRSERRRLAAFCDDKRILWVVGKRRGRAAPVTEGTKLVLELRAVTEGETRISRQEKVDGKKDSDGTFQA